MGTTGGGLWKTEDAGTTWKNISDGYFTTGSVGAVAVSESNPNIVYVGMGEHAPRGVMTSYGDGVYKSYDGGKTWVKLGLENTRQIARIVIHPQNPDIVYVAAQGAINGPSPDRGIYKSVDGGKTWQKVLYINDLTGCAELAIDYSNPRVLYAAMWHHQRLPWKVISGGPGSGIFKSTDGGQTWQKIQRGLPHEIGKAAVAVCRSNPERVYALIESDSEKEKGGLFVSTDGGKNWTKVSSDHRLVQRAWYYIEVFADPTNEHTVYVLSAQALRSIDGGKTWETINGPHGDYHDMWINPLNPKNFALADDGGVGITFNGGATFSTQYNQPTGQFYRLNADNLFPYRIYTAQQDNTSVRIESIALGRHGITRENWTYSAGGESAFLAFNPDNPRYVMGGSYLGTIEVLDSEANAGTNIMAAPIQYLGRDAKDMKYRFNWNAPILWSRHEPNTFYHAAQCLLRTRDMGKTWEEASPDLTRNEKDKQGKMGGPYTNEAVGAENYGTISYVAESPHEPGTIWVGTDDGLVQLTRNFGKTWQQVTPKGMPETLVNAIEVSPHHPGTAYIATTRYKFNDLTPAIYKTTDYGKTWVNISKGIPYGAYTRVVREDPQRKGLLFAGTETGLYVSFDAGAQWQRLQLNLPVTPITDLMIHQNNLIVATMGRAIWILDDLYLLRQYRPDDSKGRLYQPEAAVLGNWHSILNSPPEDFEGTDPYSGVNPVNGVTLYYYLPEKLPDSVHLALSILDAEGKMIRTFSSKADEDFRSYPGGPPAEPLLPRNKGMNRFVWDMRHKTMPGIPEAYIEGSYRGHKAIPGNYTIRLNFSATEWTTTVRIKANPRYGTSEAEYAEYDAFMRKLEAELADMHHKVNALYRAQLQLTELLNDLQRNKQHALLAKEAKDLLLKMKAWDEEMVQRKSKAYDDVENFPNKFTANFLFLINQTESDLPRVNEASRKRYEELHAEWEALNRRFENMVQTDLTALNRKLADAGVGAVRTGSF
jgi:photosystem II stability/assembly factor-like uncharacterized protein